MRLTCTMTMPPARRVACAIASISPSTASSSIVTLPSSSAVVPRRNATVDRHRLEEQPFLAGEVDHLDEVRRRARALPRALLPRIDERVEAGLREQARAAGGHVAHELRQHALRQRVRLDLVLRRQAHQARRIDQRARDRALEQSFVREMASRPAPRGRRRRRRSPTSGPRGLPSARKRRSTAASNASGTECPPPDPLIRIASPSSMSCAASSAVIFSIDASLIADDSSTDLERIACRRRFGRRRQGA